MGSVAAVIGQGFSYEVHVRSGEVIFKSLITKSSLIELDLRESMDVFISFKATAIHSF